MHSLKLSIIIPIFNVEKYIDKCLDSIFSQCVDNTMYEVILVNDGTQDDTLTVLRPYLEKNENCVLINQENQGVSVARNTGLLKSKGDYVWFIDSDDWLERGSIEYIIDLIKKECPQHR